MEPFYFKSYDRVIGIAHDVKELEKEMERLSKEDPAALEYHLREGHIVSWLNYIGEKGLAEMLKGVTAPKEALARIKEYELLKDSTQILPKTSKKEKRKKWYERE
ncbi:hypothetical protein [Acidianus ambivalens]|uniref:Uncharacterized protein n=1 Tax=Acidianus ambivalens TaxID=2283 RepID=A0A650CW07_ACIAM|nr:hypothetical protein [Acidianus ambivalens]MQL55592.1 hypothetical protein [Acidianus ambivalens]QGR21822.1 hypothetical protein D1866_07285 [Acidianus ambivalens]